MSLFQSPRLRAILVLLILPLVAVCTVAWDLGAWALRCLWALWEEIRSPGLPGIRELPRFAWMVVRCIADPSSITAGTAEIEAREREPKEGT